MHPPGLAAGSATLPLAAPARPTGYLGWVRRRPVETLAILIVVAIVVMALGAPWLAPYDPQEQHYDVLFHPPGEGYYFGTDDFGRDILSRVIWGARVSLIASLSAVALGASLGGLVGLFSGYFGGKLDLLLQRVMDAMMAFPILVLALAIVAATGPLLLNVILAIAVVEIPRAGRVIRSSALAIRSAQYVEAVRAVGAGNLRIVLRHVLPNCLPPYLVLATVGLGHAIIVEASLSFLGLGVPPPEPSWGGMLSGAAQKYAIKAPWMLIFPGLAISLTVYAFNLLGDTIRDIWDPRTGRS